MTEYKEMATVLKVLSEANRLKIIDILSCGQRCACEILENFDFTQPTLSHHMKQLSEVGLVSIRKEGLWSHYSLNLEKYYELKTYLSFLFTDKDDCICREIGKE